MMKAVLQKDLIKQSLIFFAAFALLLVIITAYAQQMPSNQQIYLSSIVTQAQQGQTMSAANNPTSLPSMQLLPNNGQDQLGAGAMNFPSQNSSGLNNVDNPAG